MMATAVALLIVGILGVLRGAVIVAGGGVGRVRFDAAFSIVLGFGCCLAGQELLQRGVS